MDKPGRNIGFVWTSSSHLVSHEYFLVSSDKKKRFLPETSSNHCQALVPKTMCPNRLCCDNGSKCHCSGLQSARVCQHLSRTVVQKTASPGGPNSTMTGRQRNTLDNAFGQTFEDPRASRRRKANCVHFYKPLIETPSRDSSRRIFHYGSGASLNRMTPSPPL